MNVLLQTQHYLSRRSRMACTPLLAAMLLSASAYSGPKASFSIPKSAKESTRGVITGTVKDIKNDPLPGVTIILKGTKISTTTDVNGNFRISAPEDGVLIFSFLGFERQEVSVTGKPVLNVQLKESASVLREVTVVSVGYGSKSKNDVVGAVGSIKASDIEDLPTPNIAAALRDRIVGVSVDAASGKPGAAVTLNVRNSYKSDIGGQFGVTDEPLYVIDGITVTSTEFNNLDPTLVEDITVLKDASAAIYGASGAKGVVLITTKKGKPGKPSISYTGYLGISDATSMPKMLSAYEHAKLLNDGYTVQTNVTADKFFSESDLERLKNNPGEAWIDQLWQTSAVNRHTMNVSGGSDRITYFAGGNYYDENGNYGRIKYTKYGIRTGMNAKITDDLTASVTLSTDFSRTDKSTYKNGGDDDQPFFQQLITTPRWVPLTINGLPVNFQNNVANPYALMNAGNDIWDKSQGMLLNTSLEFKPKFAKGLTAKVQFGKTNRNSSGSQFVPSFQQYVFASTGNNNLLYTDQMIGTATVNLTNTQLFKSAGTLSSYQLISSLNYGRTIGKHVFDVLAAMDQSESNTETLAEYWTGQVLSGVPEYWAFDQSTFTLHQNVATNSVQRSFLSRLNYKYDNRYILEAIARYDASSNFAPGHRWGLFPSVGLGWNISEENFFKDNINFVSFLKLRANYGLVGEARVGERLWQARYKADPNGFLYADKLMPGFNPAIVPNPEITWEKARNLNVGIDSRFLHDKLNFSMSFYRRLNYDVIDKGTNESTPMYFGFEAPVVNYGKRVSWGSEFTLGYQTRFGKDWKFNSNVNFAFTNYRNIQQKYNEFQLWDITYPDMKYFLGTNPKKWNNENFGLLTEGMFRTQEQLDAFMSEHPNYTVDGKIPQLGWLYYKDTNGDGKITEKDLVPMYNNTSPLVGFGITLGVGYKAFSLTTNLVARIGGKEFYDSKSKEEATTTVNVPSYWNDHWSLDNPNGKFPRFDDPSIAKGWNSTFWAVDGTMLRINNASLQYRVPKSFTSRIGISELRAILTGNNLWSIINPLPYKDPYSSTIYDYPTLRTVSLGLNVTL